MNIFEKIKFFFSNPSYPRTLALVGIVILAIALPVTVTVLQQRTQTQQEASGTPLCQTLKGACIRPNLCSANCNICDSSKGCLNSTICCGSCNAQYIDHRFCCNDFGNYHYCQYYQYLDCSTQKRDLGYSSNCVPPTPTPTPKPLPSCTGSGYACYYNSLPAGVTPEPGYDCGSIYMLCGTKAAACGTGATANATCYNSSSCPSGTSHVGGGDCSTGSGAKGTTGPNSLCCALNPTPTGTPCDQLGGVCVGQGNTAQTSTNSYTGNVTYANTDCTAGVMRQGICSVANTECCPKNNVIQTIDTGVVCTGPAPQSQQGSCWYNAIVNQTGPGAFIANLDVETPKGMQTLYKTTKGGSGICGTTGQLPYFMPNGTPTACLGTGSTTTTNPSCSQGSAKGTCYTNNSCGDMKELTPGQGDQQCTSPYRICCQPVNAPSTPTPTSKPGGGSGGGGGPALCQNGQSTKIALSLKLPGIGSGSFENNSPKHGNRTAIYVSVTDQNGNEVYPKNTAVPFNFTSGRFNSNTLDLGNNKLACGNTYTVHVKLATYLAASATVTYGSNQTLNMDLLPGDINKVDLVTKQIVGDGQISVLDYNFFRDNNCGKDVDPNKTIPFTDGTTTVNVTCSDLINFFDFPDGGTQGTEWADNYNLWLRSFIQANGYKI